jgi:hypothetical protein
VAPVQEVFEEQDVEHELTLDIGIVFIIFAPLNAVLSTVIKVLSFEFTTSIKSLYVL